VLVCPHCGFRYYFNPTVSAAAILVRSDGQVLLIRRAKEPALGKWAFPGGFIDFDEAAETALRRELQEELGLRVEGLRYLCSYPNAYLYAEVTYPVLDLFFVVAAGDDGLRMDPSEVSDARWLPPTSVVSEELAFDSMRVAWGHYLSLGSSVAAQPRDGH
jgi:ADP-ribose pyrophosphatase YjhB (NUDIX family)